MEKFISIKGARVNNLKNVDVEIPRNKFVVVTGLSGSGKSSLAFDTLYAEGQRRYVESLSAYARQFLGRMNKPEVEYIKGISPAIAIEQKVNSRNPRSTVGTSTEIYEYLKFLFSKIGQTYSPISGNIVIKHAVSDVVDYILNFPEDLKIIILAPFQITSIKNIDKQLLLLKQQGFSRIYVDEIFEINDENNKIIKKLNVNEIKIVIDRLIVKHDDNEFNSRLADSLQTAFYEGNGYLSILIYKDNSVIEKTFSNRYEADGIQFEEPSVNLFSFNNPYGACKKCEGFGKIIGIDEDLVIPDKKLSVFEGAVSCWHGEKMGLWKDDFVLNAYKLNFPVHKPYSQLSEKEKDVLWNGRKNLNGIYDFFKMLEENQYKIQYRVMLSRYRGKTVCPDCKGFRLRKEATYVRVADKNIVDLLNIPINELLQFFNNINLKKKEIEISHRIIIEIKNRLQYLNDVGLGYLTLNRSSSTLSGGESQRINLATSLGNNLSGSMYILDEPSIGLHPRDTARLIIVLKKLRDLGNTVIVVEHDEEIIRAADYIIDLGPEAGTNGGEIVFKGQPEDIFNKKNNFEKSYTSKYLNNILKIYLPEKRRKWKDYIELEKLNKFNLKNISVKFPLNVFTVVTGVSGSGKSTLISELVKRLNADINAHENVIKNIHKRNYEFVDQNPIGKSTRSNPVTYLKAFDDIRQLFANQSLSKLRGYKPGFFSFNVPGGRCEECQGEGYVTISMQFMADVNLVCEECQGKRYKEEVLDIKYLDKNIFDVLDLTIDDAVIFFSNPKSPEHRLSNSIVTKIKALQDVGLGYLKLGQASSTLSGGEAQRIKLASFLVKGSTNFPTIFIFDEPTTGLHFHDINKLYASFNALLNNNHTIIVIEHNTELIKCADWIIDLGPEGGQNGGDIVFEGTPDDLIKNNNSYTGKFLKKKIN